MRLNRLRLLRFGLCSVALAALLLAGGCHHNMTDANSPSPKRDINAVLADHDKRLLAIPGVVGVYVGLRGDGRTPCLKVMLANKTSENNRAIPRSLEGYLVVTEVTGETRPLRNP